jgi:hypothetical protein
MNKPPAPRRPSWREDLTDAMGEGFAYLFWIALAGLLVWMILRWLFGFAGALL